jgi:hypothetical protein
MEFKMEDKTLEVLKKKLEAELKRVGITGIYYFEVYSDGFSFVVNTELEAYKSAYLYRYCKDVKIRPTVLTGGGWLVQVYTIGGQK